MLLSALSQLVFQSPCAACKRTAAGTFCESCTEQILSGCRSQPLDSTMDPHRLFAWANYDNALRRVIRALKYDRQPAIGTWLGLQLAQSWIETGLHRQHPHLLVVPIPMHHSKQNLRGYNQAELISRSFARQVGYHHSPQALGRHRETQAQYSLNPTDRASNLQSAFSIAPRFTTQKRILLIDDIYTTGATLRSAIDVLQENNFSVWGSAVIARPYFPEFPKNCRKP